jgi:PAS domain S-box-containing protein
MGGSSAFSNMPIRNKLLVVYIGLLIPMLVIGGWGAIYLTRNTIQTHIETDFRHATQSIVNLVETTATAAIRTHLRTVAESNRQIAELFYRRALAGEITMQEARRQVRRVLLSQLIGDTGYVYCIDSQGTAVVHPNAMVEGRDFSSFPFVSEQMRLKEGYIEYEWRNPGEPAPRAKALYMVYFEPFDWIISVSAYRDEFKSLLPMKDIRSSVLSSQLSPSGYVFIADRTGQVVIHPQIKGGPISQLEMPQSVFKCMLAEKSGRLTYTRHDPGRTQARTRLVYYGSIPEYGWIVGATDYIDAIYAPVKRAHDTLIIFIVAAVSLCIAMTLGISTRITHPLKDLMAMVARGQAGDYEARVPETGSDEIGRLGGMFNDFMARLQAYHRDLVAEIEERKQTEAVLQESRLKFQAIFNQTFQLIGVLDPEGIIQEANQTALDFFGLRARDIVGFPLWEAPFWAKDEADQRRLKDAIQRAARGELCRFETSHLARDGSLHYVDFSLKPVKDVEGRVVMLIPEGRDITERKESEEVLRRSEEKYRQVVENAHDAILVIHDMRLRFANRTARVFLGYEEEDLLGQNFAERIHADDRALVIERHMRRLAGDELPQNYSIRLVARDGDVKWVEVNAVRIEWEDRPAVIVFLRDITSQKRLEAQLLQSQKMEAVGTLAGGIAHDFNNSLQAISGFVQLLLMDETRPRQDKEMLATIRQAARHAEGLTRQLLTFSRKIETNPVPLNLNRELKETCRLLERTLPKMIQVETRLQANLPIIRVDKVQLEQVIMNIGINAGHAMPDGGRLVFETAKVRLGDDDGRRLAVSPGEFVRLIISDTGVGMNEKTQQHIFEPFFTTRETGSGTGLGLATVYGIVTSHGGAITCTSAVGQGTNFKLYLPVTGLAEVDQDTQFPQAEMVGGRETILIVDVDPVVRRLGSDLLKRFGYTVLEATSGEEGLALHARRGAEIGLVILDLNMPGMGGANCLTLMMERDIPPRVIIASGYSPKGTVRETLQKGARGYIAKPFHLPEMLQMVREVLDQKE